MLIHHSVFLVSVYVQEKFMIILNVFPTHLKMIALQCLWPIVMEIPVHVAKVLSLLDNAPNQILVGCIIQKRKFISIFPLNFICYSIPFFKGYVYDPITKFCRFQFIPIPAADVYCELNVGYSPCGYNAECVYDSGNKYYLK